MIGDNRLSDIALESMFQLDELQQGRNYDQEPLRKLARKLEKISDSETHPFINDFDAFKILYWAITGEEATQENDSIIPIKKGTQVIEVQERLACQTRLALQELYNPERLSKERMDNLFDFCNRICKGCHRYDYEPLVTKCYAAA